MTASLIGHKCQAAMFCGILLVASWRGSRFGQLANNEPVRQGRHRGKSAGALRGATETELKEERSTARSLVQGYLEYLEKHDTK